MPSERVFADYLEQLFSAQYGADAVHRELETTSGRVCDFFVEAEPFRFAIEVENDTDSVVSTGVAQAQLYARQLDALPVVVYPASCTSDEYEMELLRAYCAIVPIEYPTTGDE